LIPHPALQKVLLMVLVKVGDTLGVTYRNAASLDSRQSPAPAVVSPGDKLGLSHMQGCRQELLELAS
jgi:hypothetical protein